MRRTIMMVVVIMLIFLSFEVCRAERVEIRAEGWHIISREEKISSGETYATRDAMRNAIEKVGVRVRSYTKTINQVLEEDIIETFAGAVIKIKSKKIVPEIDGDSIKIRVYIVAVVDTKNIERWELETEKRLMMEKEELDKKLSSVQENRLERERNIYLLENSLERIRALKKGGNIVEAGKISSDLLGQGIEHAELYYVRGLSNIEMERFTEALKDIEKAYLLNPKIEYLKSRGDCHFLLRAYDLAKRDYSLVIKADPLYAAAWANRGAVHWWFGNVKMALADYDRACDLGGLPMARSIRSLLEGKYEVPKYIRKGSARKVLPLC